MMMDMNMNELSNQIVTCDSCEQEFVYYKGEKPSCPHCDVDLLDLLVSLGIGWMLGDWFGLWGDD